ncbi:MAG: type IV pilus secretin PilQ [Acidobacteriota bacterium]
MIRGDRTERPLRRKLSAAFLGLAVAMAAIAGVSAADDRPQLQASQGVPAGQSAAAQLVGVNVDEQPGDSYDVVLTGDGALPYQVFTLENPTRIVFDLPGVTAATARNRYEVDHDGLVRVRVGQYRSEPDPMARVVMELTGAMGWTAQQDGSSLRIHVGQPVTTQSAISAPVTTAATETQTESRPVSVESPAPATTTALAMSEPATTTSTSTDVVPAATALVNERPQPQQASATVNERPQPQQASATSPVESRPAPQPANSAPVPQPRDTAAAEPTREAQTSATDSSSGTAAAYEAELRAIAAEASQKGQRASYDSIPAKPLLAPAQSEEAPKAASSIPRANFETKTIEDGRRAFNGRPISLNLVDADIKQVFSVFHDISGLNFVLDPAVSGAVTIVVDAVPWDQALSLILLNNSLDMILDGNVVRVAPVSKLAQEASARKALIEAKEYESAPVSITRTLSYADSKEIEKVVRDAILSPKGRVVVDPRTNTLIIRDIPTRIEAIDRLLTTLDAETPQVMIEARIVEISRDFVRDLGINWGFSAIADPKLGTQTNLDFPHRARVDYDLNLPRNPKASALGFSFGNVLDSFTLDITLDALETEGYAKRLSSPKIATQNNETAEIEQGVRIPIVSTTATEIDVRFVSASLRLKCTPQITAEGTVVLDVEVENNSPDFVNTVGDVPAINTQRAQTKVLIPDGGTTVIGGIYSVNEGKSDTGVPWLKNIPGLGWLFKSRNVQQRNRELLIFITPRIIKAS